MLPRRFELSSHSPLHRRGFERLEAGFAFGLPASPPHLTREEALDASEVTIPATAQVNVDYLRCKDLSLRQERQDPDGTTDMAPIPSFEAWKITISQIPLPRTRGRGTAAGEGGPLMGKMLVIVNDERRERHVIITTSGR